MRPNRKNDVCEEMSDELNVNRNVTFIGDLMTEGKRSYACTMKGSNNKYQVIDFYPKTKK